VVGLSVEDWGMEEVTADVKDTVDGCVGAGDVTETVQNHYISQCSIL